MCGPGAGERLIGSAAHPAIGERYGWHSSRQNRSAFDFAAMRRESSLDLNRLCTAVITSTTVHVRGQTELAVEELRTAQPVLHGACQPRQERCRGAMKSDWLG